MPRENSTGGVWQQIRSIPLRSWIVLFGCTFMAAVIDGYVLQYGLLKLELEREYSGVPVELIAIIASLVPAEYCIFAPLVLSFLEVVSLRYIVMTGAAIQAGGFLLSFANEHLIHSFAVDMLALGFLQGLGASMQFVLSFVIINKHFPNNMGLATGIMTCGSPLGALVFGATYEYMVALPIGWTSVQLFFAGLSIITVGLAFFFVDPNDNNNMTKTPDENQQQDANAVAPPSEPSEKQDRKTKAACGNKVMKSYKSQFTRKICTNDFFVVLVMTSFSLMGYYVPTLLITQQADNPAFGVTPIVRNNLVFVWGGLHLLGRIVAGQLADMSEKSRIFSTFWLYIIGLLVSAATLLVFPFVMHLGNSVFITVVAIYGFFSAPFIALQGKLCEEYYFETEEEQQKRKAKGQTQSPYSQAFSWLLFSNFPVIIVGFAVSTHLNTIEPLWAYLFASLCFVFGAACLGSIYKGYFTALDKLHKSKAKQQTFTAAKSATATLEEVVDLIQQR